GEKTGSLVVDNVGSLRESFIHVETRIGDPYSDRGLPVRDEIRDKMKADLETRKVGLFTEKILAERVLETLGEQLLNLDCDQEGPQRLSLAAIEETLTR